MGSQRVEPAENGAPSERLRAARERAGLEASDVADRAGLPLPHYCDLEAFDDDVWSTISLETLLLVSRELNVTPSLILEGRDTPGTRMAFGEFSAAIAAAIRKDGGDADAWGERVGWDVAPLLEDPEAIWELNAEGLRDIANAAGLDWRAVLPE